MAQYIFKMPDIGEGVVEGEVVAWHVKPGDYVKEDQPLVDIMTDKATVTIPSTVHGTIVRTNGKMGEMIAVGRELVVFETDKVPAAAEAASPNGNPPPSIAAVAPPPVSPSPPVKSTARPEPAPRTSDAARPLASPAVRRKAKEVGVDLALVPGSGPAGRISGDDLEAYLGRRDGAAVAVRARRTGFDEVPVLGLRRKIAEKMTASARNIPHFSYFEEVDVTELERLRDRLQSENGVRDLKLTFVPFIVRALVKALTEHPQCNAHYDEARGVVIRHRAIHIGIAAQTDRGLMVPVVRHAEALDLFQTAAEIRRVADAAKNNTAKLDELTGSTFTLTSLGAIGGLGATPIINHPEVGILGVHKAEDRAVVRNGQIVIRKMMNLSSSFDHRIVDGADGARMVQTVKTLLEHPAMIFIGAG